MNSKKILAFALGPVASAALGLIAVPAMAWAFSPEDVGRLNILQVSLSFCLLFSVLGLDQAYVREFHESSDRLKLLKACFIPGFLILLITGILAIAFDSELSRLLYATANPTFYWITFFCAITLFISRFLSLILRMEERGLAFSMSQIIPKALQLLLLFFAIIFSVQRDFFAILGITFLSSFAVLVVCAWNTRKQWIPAIYTQPNALEIKSLLKFGFPLIFSGIAYWGLNATSTFVLRTNSSLSELGIYSVTSSFAGVAVIFQSIFTVIWAPTVYKWVAEGADMARVDNVAKKALVLVCAIFIAVGSFSWFADHLLPPHYRQVKYFLVCAIAPSLLYTLSEVTCVGIGIMRRTSLTIWITLSALLANSTICLMLVPKYGAAGAVIANTLGYLVFFIARTEASAYVWRNFPRAKIYVFISLLVAFSVMTVVIGPMAPINHSLAWTLLTPIFIWFFRCELLEFIKSVQKNKVS